MGFFRRWKEGIEAISPLQSLRIKRFVSFFQCAGMLFAIVAVGLFGLWYWLPFLIFTLIMLVLDWLSTHQQVVRLEKMLGGGRGGF